MKPATAYRLAILYDRQENSTKALAEYQIAVKAAPKDANLLNDFGYFHYERGDYAEAEQLLTQATKADPTNARAWVNLGMTLAQLDRFAEALAAFGKVLPPAEAQYNLGVLLAAKGKTEDARTALREASNRDVNLAPARAALTTLEQQPAVGSVDNGPRFCASLRRPVT